MAVQEFRGFEEMMYVTEQRRDEVEQAVEDMLLARVLRKFLADDGNYVRLTEAVNPAGGMITLDGSVDVTVIEFEALKKVLERLYA